MAQSFDPVFDFWHSEKCIGIGTDGRVYTIVKNNEDGTVSRSILKTIRLAENRNEGRGYNLIGGYDKEADDESFNKTIEKITDNINSVMEKDAGKRFVKYEQYEVRDASDSKGKVILIRLEEMRSLTAVLSQFSFTLNETLNLGISICKSLMRCRDFGYIYPNLKPENILFDARGVCKLGDFGAFSCLEAAKTSIAYKKTQYYRAPEFLETDSINSTCDTYSLGLVLYMLTNRGSLPFTEQYPQEVTVNGLNRSVEMRLKGEAFPKPVLASEELFSIIKRACAPNVKDRYLTPAQMLNDLESVLANKPFEETRYEDLYSKSEKDETDEEKLQNSGIESGSKLAQENKTDKKTSDESREISLEKEIKIPDVSPLDYFDSSEIPDGRKKERTPYVAPITKKKKKPSAFSQSDIIRIAILVTAILCILVLLVVSLSLRSSNKDDKAQSAPQTAVIDNFGGDGIWRLK